MSNIEDFSEISENLNQSNVLIEIEEECCGGKKEVQSAIHEIEIINKQFENIEIIKDECCGGNKDVQSSKHEVEVVNGEINGGCHCEEKRHICKCQLTPKDEECKGPIVPESLHRWKCMMLLVTLVIVICWVVIFTSLMASGTI